MTEFETATLALQQAALWRSDISTALTAVIGLGQCFLIWWGIRKMATQGAKREEQHADRHAETMEAFRQQAEAAKVQHAENMEALRQQAEAAKAQHTETMEALRALIERTAPPTGQ